MKYALIGIGVLVLCGILFMGFSLWYYSSNKDKPEFQASMKQREEKEALQKKEKEEQKKQIEQSKNEALRYVAMQEEELSKSASLVINETFAQKKFQYFKATPSKHWEFSKEGFPTSQYSSWNWGESFFSDQKATDFVMEMEAEIKSSGSLVGLIFGANSTNFQEKNHKNNMVAISNIGFVRRIDNFSYAGGTGVGMFDSAPTQHKLRIVKVGNWLYTIVNGKQVDDKEMDTEDAGEGWLAFNIGGHVEVKDHKRYVDFKIKSIKVWKIK